MQEQTLAQRLRQILDEYRKELDESTTEVLVNTAQSTVQRLKQWRHKKGTASKGYAKGWKVETTVRSYKGIELVIYNNKKPQLTHLLNNGHANRGGGRTAGDHHIDIASDEAETEVIKEVERRLSE